MGRLWQWLMGMFEAVGADADDPPDLQLKKRSLVALAVLVGSLGVVWGAMYVVVDEPVAASIPLLYSLLSAVSIAVFSITRRFLFFRASQLVLVLLLPFVLMVALGGFVNSSAVILWSLLAPLGALLIAGRRAAVSWFGGFVFLVVVSGFIQPFVRETNNLSTGIITLFFVMNLMAVPLVVFVLLLYFVGQRDRAMDLLDVERGKSERLLLNVLPETIAALLKEEEQTIAHHHPAASVLFADVVGFTPLSSELAPDEMVDLLNEVFSYFDELCDRFGVEKIRTIGDNYMVAAGVPDERPDHAQALTTMAIAMNAFANGTSFPHAGRLRFRFGINSGPLIAGVIGNTKFQYDIWGDTVNTASRMESHGVPGKIQITEATYRLVAGDFVCEPRGTIDVKGKGPMPTWFVEGVRPA